jgi:hypothetical protein
MIMSLLTLLVSLRIMAFFGKVASIAKNILDAIFHVYVLLKLVVYMTFGFPLVFIVCCMPLALDCASLTLDAPSFARAFFLNTKRD